MVPQYVWEDFNNPRLSDLRKRYDFERAVSIGKSEFEKQLLLKDWVYRALPLGYNNTNQYKNAFEVLADSTNSGGFNCTWYVLVFLQCAAALGWYARKLGIDKDHNFGDEEMRHTVVDIWSNQYKKWYVIDPMFNAHFEINKIPLNAYEVRKAYLSSDRQFNKVFGNYGEEKLSGKIKDRHDNLFNYFWFFVLLRNDFLVNPDVYASQALLWVDEFNKDKTWYVGGKNKGEFRKHPMYDGAFIETDDYKVCFPDMK